VPRRKGGSSWIERTSPATSSEVKTYPEKGRFLARLPLGTQAMTVDTEG
jgi:hypothetical protein